MRIAICPGSFDPVTNGHIDIIDRASKLFEVVIAAVLNNPEKQPLFTLEERVAMLIESTSHLGNIRAETFDGLVVEYAREIGASAIVKGLRAVSDFEYELQMASWNRWLNPGIETIFMMTSAQYAYLSSSAVKQVVRFGGSVAGLVPAQVEKRIKDKFSTVR